MMQEHYRGVTYVVAATEEDAPRLPTMREIEQLMSEPWPPQVVYIRGKITYVPRKHFYLIPPSRPSDCVWIVPVPSGPAPIAEAIAEALGDPHAVKQHR